MSVTFPGIHTVPVDHGASFDSCMRWAESWSALRSLDIFVTNELDWHISTLDMLFMHLGGLEHLVIEDNSSPLPSLPETFLGVLRLRTMLIRNSFKFGLPFFIDLLHAMQNAKTIRLQNLRIEVGDSICVDASQCSSVVEDSEDYNGDWKVSFSHVRLV